MILVIDNYDSFTYNLVQYFGELGTELTVRRNDKVGLDEIERAGRAWTAYRGPDRRGTAGATPGRFPRVAKNWLRFHGRLAVPPAPVHPYEKEITDFVEFLRSTNGATPATIHGYRARAKLFLTWLATQGQALSLLTLNDVRPAVEFIV